MSIPSMTGARVEIDLGRGWSRRFLHDRGRRRSLRRVALHPASASSGAAQVARVRIERDKRLFTGQISASPPRRSSRFIRSPVPRARKPLAGGCAGKGLRQRHPRGVIVCVESPGMGLLRETCPANRCTFFPSASAMRTTAPGPLPAREVSSKRPSPVRITSAQASLALRSSHEHTSSNPGRMRAPVAAMRPKAIPPAAPAPFSPASPLGRPKWRQTMEAMRSPSLSRTAPSTGLNPFCGP